MFRSTFPALAIAAASLLLAGCASTPLKPFYSRFPYIQLPLPKLEMPSKHTGDFWEDHGGDGNTMIVVKLGEQRAYFYRGRKVVGATKISTGKKGFSTPAGVYRVMQKDAHHVSSLYGDYVDAEGSVTKSNVDVHKDAAPPGSTFRGAKMPYFLRFEGGHGLHAGHVPNHPASHGCVRLPSEMAKRFFDASQIGTPVVIEK